MSLDLNQLDNILDEANQQISAVKTTHDLANLKSAFIGKKSILNEFMKQLGTLTPEERPAFGKRINDIKVAIETKLVEAEERIQNDIYTASVKSTSFDHTMPGRPYMRGRLHPLTAIQQQIEDIFIDMGYQVAEDRDIEDEFHNFDALNTPADHPARNLADTFYIRDQILLRTHTSTVQIRVMEQFKPPIRIISPGRSYRNDKFDATHSPVFHQVEGLVVDEGISFRDLKFTLHTFVKQMFGPDCHFRFRPHFFPFTEPSAEVDITCFVCEGKGCPTCKHSGWIEILGAGMVDPNVFEALGIDSERYTGFAFGCGIDRMTMLRLKVPDIRLLYENLLVMDA